jgi:signal transduction histidine kinase
MSLRKKLILLSILSGCLLMVLFQTSFHFTMRPSLENQKSIFLNTLKTKIRNALISEEERISALCKSWAQWENMANYVKTASTTFADELFPDVIFSEEMMDMVVVVDSHKTILSFKAYKEEEFLNRRQMNIDREIHNILKRLSRNPALNHMKGIIHSDMGPLMIVAYAIETKLQSVGGRPREEIVGALILGRFIHNKMLNKIPTLVMEGVNTFSFDKEQVSAFFTSRMMGRDQYYKEKQDRLTVYNLLRDIDNKPAVILYAHTDNRLFRVVQQHAITFGIVTFLSILALGLVLYFAIQTQIVNRMLNISSTMKKIERLEDLSTRISSDKKRDEISYLVTNINGMLDKLNQEKIKRENAEKAMITNGKLASIGRLASCIGHEVNNPILAISNSIQVIKKISRSKSELFHEAIEISESEINRIRDLISSLLDFHRMEHDEFISVDVREIVHQSLNVLKWSKKLGSVEIVPRMEEDCCVLASPVKLKQVFINFILNAVEALQQQREGDGGMLQVEVKKYDENHNDFVEVHFLDNGPGIPEEIKGNLFEPFVSTKAAKGVGLGLYISYKIIHNHRGEVLHNEDYNEGTHFIIKFPGIKKYNDANEAIEAEEIKEMKEMKEIKEIYEV